MNKSFEAFKATLEEFTTSKLGMVEESLCHGTRPFISGTLRADIPHRLVSESIVDFAALAVKCGAYLTMVVHREFCVVQLMVTREPLADELKQEASR